MKKHRERMRIIGLFIPQIPVAIPKRLQIVARSKDGVRPANHTNASTAHRESTKENFRPPPRNTVTAKPAKKERCMPDRASTWARPAERKASPTSLSVYSPEPQSKATNKPPASPQPYISLLNWSRHNPRNS